MIDLSQFVPLLAHTAPASGAIEGFLHPILGLDHLIAMVVVGVLSAHLGGRAIWTVPAAFVVMMCIGGILGLLDIGLPLVEPAIATSLVVLGILLFFRKGLPEWVALVTVGVFATFHGYAHGTSLPEQVTDPVIIIAYVVGFLIATAGLHVIGALIGFILLRSQHNQLVMRVVAVATALSGVIFLVNLANV